MQTKLLIARWSPAKATHKLTLIEACEASKISPRQNWLWPSHREFLARVSDLANSTGVIISSRVDRAQPDGSQDEYQSLASWAIRHPSGPPTIMSWNTKSGKFQADLRHPAYAAFKQLLPQAIQQAREEAEINRVDARDQMALVLMQELPMAPFCSVPHIGPGLWMMAEAGTNFNRARKFLQKAGCPALTLSEIDGPNRGKIACINNSAKTATRRFSNRIGWREISSASHAKLAELVNNEA